MAVILRYFTEFGSFREALCKSGCRCRHKKVHVRYLISWWVYRNLVLTLFNRRTDVIVINKRMLLAYTIWKTEADICIHSWIACKVTTLRGYKCVSWSAGRSVTVVSPGKTAEPTEMSFGWRTQVGPRKLVLDGVHWRHLANTTELSMCGGNAACCQITLTTCYY